MAKKTLFCLTLFIIFIHIISAQENDNQYSLQKLTDSMYINNIDLRKAHEEYKKSLYDVKDAKASLGPNLTFQMSGTYMTNPTIDAITVNVDDLLSSISWPSGYTPTSSGQYITLYDGMENTMYNLQLTLQQPVFTWGKLRSAVTLYNEVSQMKLLQINSKTSQLETELKTRVMSLIYLKDIEVILNQEKEYAARMVSVSEDAEKSGMLLHQDVVEAQIQAKELDITIENVNEQIQTQLLQLQKLTGIDNLTLDNIYFKIDENLFTEVSSYNRDEIEKQALSETQENLQLLDMLKNVNDISVNIAKNSVYWKPDIALEASAGYSGPRVPLFESNYLRKDDYSLNISFGLRTTVWDGGKKLNDISRAISEATSTSINKDEAILTIKQTLKEQWNSFDVCVMRIDYQDLKIETADSKIKQQEEIFASGYGSETDLLKAKIERCNAQIEKIQQQLKLASSCYMIQYLAKKN